MEVKKENKEVLDVEIITAYVQLVHYTLKKSGTEINNRNIKNEVKMFYQKFGNNEVKRLANLIIKEKK